MTRPGAISRRSFVQLGATAAGGLLLTVGLPGCGRRADAGEEAPPTPLNAFVEIGPDGLVTVTIHRPEIGQGSRTALAMIVAEELGASWDDVRVVQADLDEELYGPQYTGGSDSVERGWEPLRRAGAAARAVLVGAAAARWGVDPAGCDTRDGAVVHEPSGRTLPFARVVGDAASRTPPEDPPLRDPSAFRLVGTPRTGVDAGDIAAGATTFGLDVLVPGMLRAVVARAPVHGGRVRGFDDQAARAVDGVVDVVRIDPAALPASPPNNPWMPDGVAVLAETTWSAFKGRDALEVAWDEGPAAGEDTRALFDAWRERARRAPDAVIRRDGDVDGALDRAAETVEAEYEVPFLAHAPMEPMNAVASVTDGACEVWAPTQNPGSVRELVALAVGLPPEAVAVHVVRSGGGFGRRFYSDYAAEAALLSAAAGRPVQVVWSREDDMQYSFHRPAGVHRLRGGVDGAGRLVAWDQHLVNAPRAAFLGRRFGPGEQGEIEAVDFPAEFVPNLRYAYSMEESAMPRGQWRAVEASSNVFVQQAFLDELAGAAGADPLDFHRALLGDDHPVPWYGDRTWDSGRLRRVLETAAREAGWGEPLPAGRGRGIAASFANSSFVAHVAEVTVDGDGGLSVDRVVTAMDCGVVVNPSGARAQVEGCIVYGLSAALYGENTLEGGRPVETNFHTYRPLRIDEMPEVEVHFVPGADRPQGVGEPPLPPLAPAVANAVFDAVGVRVRRLPMAEDVRRAVRSRG